MRILLLTQYFDPEPQLKGMVLARELARRGHQVEVLTGFPNYPGGKVYPGYKLRLVQREMMEGIRVTRVPLYPSHDSGAVGRMLNYVSFGLSAALLGPFLVERPDVVHAYHGNATIGLPACTIGMVHRAPFVLDIQDLWPDSITASGMLPRYLGGFVALVGLWCRFLYRQAAQIAVLSKGFKEELAARGVQPDKVTVIPNWCDEVQAEPGGELPPEEAALLEGRFNVVMAGNMGKMQGLDVVLDAAVRLQREDPLVQFLLVGGGVDRPRLEERAAALGLSNVRFLPRRPVTEIGALLHRADALLVHLKDDPLFAITIPSRIQAYMAVGRPLLCGVRGNGSELVQEAEAGLCFEPENADSLAEQILALRALAPEARELMGERGRRYYRSRLSVAAGTSAFLELFWKAGAGVQAAPDHAV